ncbi:MAG TPA: peptidase S8 [Flavobacteriales bacterium]|nr:peptidase S8 [Flavobacteriales bacterium]|tara:strand:- start:21172 stop:22779 length:1608 start_codon:yes stop_codon:yes gene_type:complete
MERNKRIVLLLTLFLSVNIFAQDRYWVVFSDKNNSPYSLQNPEQFLSSKSLQRRTEQNYPLDSTDLPINPQYLNLIKPYGQILFTSKWFNAACIVTDSLNAGQIAQIQKVDTVYRIFNAHVTQKKINKFTNITKTLDYGIAAKQIQMLKGDFLHQLGYLGNKTIAVIDAGFNNTDSIDVFGSLRSENRILSTYNAVLQNTDVYSFANHGTQVLSIITADIPGQMTGTAPKAKVHLLISEDMTGEQIIEEYYFVRTLEYADSAGVEVFNTSLGYTTFDDSTQNHTYNDLNGKTAINSIACSLAVQKGMLPVLSAGNSGANPWHFIGTPADAINSITVGAVDENEFHAPFSSYGPAADGRIKPEVCALGALATVANPDNSIGVGSGTSFSAPVICGLTACLWEAFPEKTNLEIREAIIKSAHLYNNPNDSMGYGIPDFKIAYQLLRNDIATQNTSQLLDFSFNNNQLEILLYYNDDNPLVFKIYDLSGKILWEKEITLLQKGELYFFNELINPLSSGVYVFSVNGNKKLSKKFIVVK